MKLWKNPHLERYIINMNMENNLTIIIVGETASGKSTTAVIIKEALKERGFVIEFDGYHTVLTYRLME